MALFKSDPLSKLVAVRPHALNSFEAARVLQHPSPLEQFRSFGIHYSPQSSALLRLLEAARKRRTALLFGSPGVGKSTVMGHLAYGLAARPQELEAFREGLGNPALSRAFSAARSVGKRWLVLQPSASEGSIDACLQRALARAARSAGLEDVEGDLVAALRSLQEVDWLEGMAVLFDGFESLVSCLWREPASEESDRIRRFSELCKAHRFPLFFVGVMDRSLGRLSPEEELRLVGVFEQIETIALPGRLGEWEELVARSVLERHAVEDWDELVQQRDFRYQISSLRHLKVYEGRSEEWVEQVVVKGNYPLHPAAAFLLPRLSAFTADADHNAFSFFSDLSPGGLGYFLTNFKIGQPDGRLSFYTLDLLCTYYRETLAASVPESHDVLERAVEAASDVPHGRRLLQTLWLLQLVGHSRLPASPEALLWCLHLGEKEASAAGRSLKVLVHRKIIEYDAESRRFRLPYEAEELDLGEQLRALRRRMPERVDSHQLLLAHAPPGRLPTVAINRDFHTDRYVAVRFVRREELERPYALDRFLDGLARARPYCGDLVLAYVLGQRKEELDRIQALCHSGKFRHPRLVLALPTRAYNFAAEANEVAAARRLLTTVAPFCDPTTARYALLQEKLAQAEAALAGRIQEFLSPENLEVRYGDVAVKGLDSGELQEFLGSRLRELLGHPPVVRSRALSTVQDPPACRNARHQAIDYMLGCGPSIAIRADEDLVHEALRAGLVDTGLVDLVREGRAWSLYRFSTAVPPEGLGRSLELLRDQLVRQSRPVPLGPLLEGLAAPPLSLPSATLEFFLGALVCREGRRLRLTGPEGTLGAGDLKASILASMVTDPEGWTVEHQECLRGEEEFLLGVLRGLGTGEVGASRSLHRAAADRLVEWYRRLELRERRLARALGPKIQEFLALLESKAEDPVRLLRALVPLTLGWSQPPDWERESSSVLARLLETLEAVEDLEIHLRRRIHRRFRELFSDGSQSSLQDPWPVLAYRWFISLPDGVRQEPGKDSIKFLLSAYSSSSTDEDEHLNDLLFELGYPPVEQWERDHSEELWARAHRARRELDFQDFAELYPLGPGSGQEFARQGIAAMVARTRLQPEAVAEVLQQQLEQVAW